MFFIMMKLNINKHSKTNVYANVEQRRIMI
jgi:hypothetical protein